MIQVPTIDRENIQYLIRNLEDFEKDKAVKSGLRAAVNVFRVKGRSNLGFERPGGNHSHLVDQGTKKRYTNTGKSRGSMPGNRFWNDAGHTEENRAMQAIYQGVQKAVQRINERR